MNDVISTSATLFSLVFAKFNSFPIDGYIGFFVSIFVFKAGLDVFSDTVTPLLGKAPDPAFVNAIYEFVMSHELSLIHIFIQKLKTRLVEDE